MKTSKLLKALLVIPFCLSVFQGAANSSPDAYITFHTSKNYLGHINRGYIAMDTRNYPLALKEFMTARYINDELFAAYDGLGRVYELTRNYGKALASYQRALDLISPKYAQDLISSISKARQNQETRKALGLYKIVLSIRPESGLQVLYGDKYMADGNYERALVNYKRAYTLQENPNEYLKHIQLKYPNKEYERYIVRKYIQKSLSNPDAHYKAGLASLQRKNYRQAIEEFSMAVSQITVPSVENKYLNYLGQAYYRQGQQQSSGKIENFDKAIGLFEQYLDNEPKNQEVLFKLAEANYYKDLARYNQYNGELDKLEKEYGKIADLDVQEGNNSERRRELLNLMNKKYNIALFDNTLDILQQIESFDYFDPGVYYSIGNVYSKKGMIYHKGFYDREKYLNSNKVSTRNKAWDYYRMALEEYKKYITKAPNNNGLVYYDIGLLYYQSSKLEADRNKLPLTKENIKEYQRWGTKFFKRDMMNRSIANFKKYLNYHPGASNTPEINRLMREMQLAMVVNW